MPASHRKYVVVLVAAAAMLINTLGASTAFAHAAHPAAGAAPSARSVTAPAVTMHTVNMRQVAAQTPSQAAQPVRTLPLLTGLSAAAYAQRKAAAARTLNAPADLSATSGLYTPATLAKFNGMADGGAVCNCQPPDQALAASSSWVFQGVNTAFAVYNTTGVRQSGWPKPAPSFFGVPTPSGCGVTAPFLSDPRAFYDPTDGRFWAAMLEVEGAFGVNNCPERTYYWVAVSQTNNPNGTWNVYAFNMAINVSGSCATCAADYTQFGFDQTAIYFSGNMFTQSGSAYDYAETYSVLKSAMESGTAVTAYGFFGFKANGVFVDTVQPVENEASSGPGAGLLINSFNINGNGSANCASTACKGLVVWAIANPGTASASLTGVIITNTTTYIAPPQADQPGHPASVETLDTRISGTPVYQQGLISFALETGLNNGTHVVPAIFWGQVKPTISGGAITGASVFQSGSVHFTGDRAASFGALMATSTGNLLMVFDTMSSTIFPSIMYTTRLTTDKAGTFGAKVFLKKGTVATVDTRWGDYEAASYDGATGDNTWFSSQYPAASGDWATYIGKVHF
ncbi:MAG TPA: hypothetical protein VGN32_07215 [Ktedonobacterales bacterium]|nr:hypothetical protein [Ktedonobacterales bacterium]